MKLDLIEALYIIPRSAISLVVLFIITKLIGKKQVSELSLFDYVIGISIGNFTAEMVMNFDYQYVNGIIAIATFGIISYLVSLVSLKSINSRRIIMGQPTIVIEQGKININSLRKNRLNINNLLELCRGAGYFDISEISYAILEVNGNLSILPKSDYQVPNLKDLKIKKDKAYLAVNVIIDGVLMPEYLKYTNKNIDWLNKELEKQGYANYDNILLATINNGKLSVFEKQQSKIKNI